MEQAVVFTSTQRDADWLADRLADMGHAVASLHGGMPQGRRTRVLQGLRNKQLKVLVATDVAARGIDVPSISHVINYGLPMKAEDYVHRIGRTGRAGRNGLAVTLAERMDSGMIRRIQQFTTQNIPVATIVGLEPKSPEPRMFAPRPDAKFGGSKPFGHARPAGPGKSFGNKPFGKPAHQRAGEGFAPRDRAPFDRDRAPFDRDSAQHNRFSPDRPNDRHNSVFVPNGQPAPRVSAFDRAPVDRNTNGFAPRKPAGAPAGKGGFSKPQRPRPGGFSR
jgi:superfamily II DNA/RNA helicase